jgi:leader peptidase (prepilin peptidase)/N-methyltransferase
LSDLAFVAVVSGLGLIVGSFLNVCIHRLPLRESVLWGRSHCPSCGRQIRAWENIPVLSWLMLRGRCAGCRAPIAIKYPLVEIATAIVFGISAWVLGPTPLLVIRLVFSAAMIVLFMIDLEHRILPNVITLPGIVLGLGFSLFETPGLRDALIGAAIFAGVLWAVGEGVGRVLKRDALGFGDVKMAAMIGAFLGWQQSIVTFALVGVVGTLISLTIVAIMRNRYYEIPLGSMLAVAAIVAGCYGPQLTDWYLYSFSGLPR